MPLFVKNCAALALLVLTCALSVAAHAAPGQPGTLDATWAASSSLGAGKVITPALSGGGSDNANALVLQPDGKVVLVGACSNAANTSTSFCTLRYNADGTLDTSFGTGGLVVTVVSALGATAKDFANAAAIQPDGKFVLAGRCYNGNSNANGPTYDFCVARHLANGTLDSTFGSGGKVITSLGATDHAATTVAVQPDGKLVLAGDCVVTAIPSVAHFCAVRYLANGTLDSSFNGTGKIITAIASVEDHVTGLAVLPDGKLVLAGYCFSTASNKGFCALRYLANGTLDTSFGGANTGKVTTPISASGSTDHASALAMQPDGKLIIAGYCDVAGYKNICVARYFADGVLDVSFGGGALIVPAAAGRNEAIAAISVQPDGKVLLAGSCDNRNNEFGGGYFPDFCALRFNDNGVLDKSFGDAGKVVTQMGGFFNTASAAALQPDGKLVIAGYCQNSISSGTGVDFCALRYDGGPFGYQNCKPDLDGDGVFAASDALIFARVALGINGNAVIAGITFPQTTTRNTWPLIRSYLVAQCGMTLGP